MKIVHLSDLHLGKRIYEISMLSDQRFILNQCLDMIREEQPEAVLVAGDIYDKGVPPAEAVTLFDDFLYELSKQPLQVFLIAGNHDSPERIAFGSRLLDRNGIHLSPVFAGAPEPCLLTRDEMVVAVYLLPFIKPVNVRAALGVEAADYTEALQCVISKMEIDPSRINILVSHQFVTGGTRSESETFQVGGTDNVNLSVFDPFDYVALGHLHAPQSIGRETVRYCGTPLTYSFSEINQEKSMTVIEIEGKGKIQVRTRKLTPLHEMREVRGTYNELMLRNFYQKQNREDYLHIVLTDEEDLPDAISRLRMVYPNLMKLDYDNKRTNMQGRPELSGKAQRSPLDLFGQLYKQQNGTEMNEEQIKYLTAVIEELEEKQ